MYELPGILSQQILKNNCFPSSVNFLRWHLNSFIVQCVIKYKQYSHKIFDLIKFSSKQERFHWAIRTFSWTYLDTTMYLPSLVYVLFYALGYRLYQTLI